jgi:hypothetical protein
MMSFRNSSFGSEVRKFVSLGMTVLGRCHPSVVTLQANVLKVIKYPEIYLINIPAYKHTTQCECT